MQIEHNRIKNPNWQEDNQLAIYNRGQGFELGTTENESSKWTERLLDFKSHALDTWPRCLHKGHCLLLLVNDYFSYKNSCQLGTCKN